ncbi:small multi-drug export protein [Natronorarus salvus]|uniref:small multi-drug export protein n=1 Tax=Natronorarus salvus TaxID=3117733 RepID=UPI002F263B00
MTATGRSVALPLWALPSLVLVSLPSVGSETFAGGGLLAYFLVFLAAATPWLEILLVIPPAVAAGLDPVLVAAVALVGNVLPVWGIILGYDGLRGRWRAWRGEGEQSTDDGENEPSKRRQRAEGLFRSYGLPGLALAGPILTGVHLATVVALALGGRARPVAIWMGASLALWTAIITLATVYGLSLAGFSP